MVAGAERAALVAAALDRPMADVVGLGRRQPPASVLSISPAVAKPGFADTDAVGQQTAQFLGREEVGPALPTPAECCRKRASTSPSDAA